MNANRHLEYLPNDDTEYEGSIIAHQFSKIRRQFLSNRDVILLGLVRLVDVRCQPSSCRSELKECDCKAVFCKTDPTLHNESPEFGRYRAHFH